MKIYIDFKTKKRKNAANSFEKKKKIKLMINSVYCKTMKNLRKRISVKVVKMRKIF